MSILHETDDLRIRTIREVTAPEQLHTELPISEAAATTVFQTRKEIHNILNGSCDRLLVIVGPCSIHDTQAADEYANKLKVLKEQLNEHLLIVMRVYFEKPRTSVGWKGLINDPKLDDSFNINEGLHIARQLLLNLSHIGMPAATEYLDLITPQYISDLISWGAIGARTTESQVHRELASGLSCPVGFKNSTDGNLKTAIDAINAASNPHHFLSVTKKGRSAIFSTTGNDDCHIILRGGSQPNYDAASIDSASQALLGAKLTPALMIDISHANSQKQYQNQTRVGHNVASQIASGDTRIIGTMIESHLKEGRQNMNPDQPLTYGQSITDACIGWDKTTELLQVFAEAVKQRRTIRIKE